MPTMTKFSKPVSVALALTATLGLLAPAEQAYARGEADCAIWLCMPAGFPTGCSSAWSAFKKRIRKGRSPLPNLMSCTRGKSSGSYRRGFEAFETCQSGYTTQNYFNDDDRRIGSYNNSPTARVCTDLSSCRSYGRDGDQVCSRKYVAQRRAKPHWIDMTIDGKPLGRFFYSMR